MSDALPTLRRHEDGERKAYATPTTIIGKATGWDGAMLLIEGARNVRTLIDTDDLNAAFENRELGLGLLMDAVIHQDTVRIGVETKRITYANSDQQKRFEALAKEAEPAG